MFNTEPLVNLYLHFLSLAFAIILLFYISHKLLDGIRATIVWTPMFPYDFFGVLRGGDLPEFLSVLSSAALLGSHPSSFSLTSFSTQITSFETNL